MVMNSYELVVGARARSASVRFVTTFEAERQPELGIEWAPGPFMCCYKQDLVLKRVLDACGGTQPLYELDWIEHESVR